MLCIHSFHISCQCYFLRSFIWLSNKLMVFQLHSAAVQRAGSVTVHIWCNLCVDKWGAEFPGCKAYGCNSVWAGPGRAPFSGCQVAWGQVCEGAAQSAPSNWNVDQGAGIASSLFPLIEVYTHDHTWKWAQTLKKALPFVSPDDLKWSINFSMRPVKPARWVQGAVVFKMQINSFPRPIDMYVM